MSDLKLVSFEANESGLYPLSFHARQSEIRVFTGDCDGGELESGSDFAIEPSIGGSVNLKVSAPHDGPLWVAFSPDTSFHLTKFGVQMMPDLNSWFGRLSSRLALIDYRLDNAIGSDPGCDGNTIISGIRSDITSLYALSGTFLNTAQIGALLDAELDARLLARKRALYSRDELEQTARRSSSILQAGADYLIEDCGPPIRVRQDCVSYDPFCLVSIEMNKPDGVTAIGKDVMFNSGDEIEGCTDLIIAGFSKDCSGNCIPQYRCPTKIEQR